MFGLNLANFKTKDGYKLVKDTTKDVAGSISPQNLKQQLYHSLQTKFKTIDDERDVLLQLVQHVHSVIHGKHAAKQMKTTLSPDGLRVFNEMYEEVTNAGKSKDKLTTAFHVLLLHMGLQLLNDETLAISAIDELKLCMRRVKVKKSNSKKEKVSVGDTENEPEWIEVVVDLFLHLLSQNSSLLRNIINKLFPQFCPHMTLEALHQILSLLDMTVENPLSHQDDEDEDSDAENPSDKEDEESSSDDENMENGVDEKEESDDNDDDEDDDEEDSMMGEEGNVTDQLRSAVREALTGATVESDVESLDLDQMDESEGRRLDNALAVAFKMYSENRQRNKKSKKEKAIATTVTHFRLRILDLLEIYIKTEPQMSFLLEIVVTLFDLLNDVVKDAGPMLTKVEHILTKITSIKHFTKTDGVTDENLSDILKNLTEKKFSSFAIAKQHIFLSKCVVFIVMCSKNLSKSHETPKLSALLSTYLNEFIISRNPILPLHIFTTIFGLVWNGIWELGRILITKGIENETSAIKSLRRTQIIALLTKIFHNHQLLNSDLKRTENEINFIETELFKWILSQSNHVTVTQKVFGELLELLIEINRCHSRIPSIPGKLIWNDVNDKIQVIRRKLTLDASMNVYRKYCQIMKLEFEKNVDNKPELTNGNGFVSHDENETSENELSDDDDNSGSGEVVTKKRKKSDDKKKLKKQKEEAREKFSSKGLNGGFSFAQLNADEIDDDDEDVQERNVSPTKPGKKVKDKPTSAKKAKKMKVDV